MDEATMETIRQILIWIPLPYMLITYYMVHTFSKNKWRAIHIAVDLSTVFYIIASAVIVKEMFEITTIGYILVALLIMLAIVLIKQWKDDTEVVLLKGFRLLMRICFIPVFIIYIGLIIYKLV
ncbi:MAG TPA: DUF3397 domain-containing protein [Pseudogracilibacillus sp.]|nr:DUF3397 domain-containing protein [Pseudogracilibacillus sp.]